MDCPNCGAERLADNWLELWKTIRNFALFGFGSSKLYFDADDEGSELILRTRRAIRARRCGECRTLVAVPQA